MSQGPKNISQLASLLRVHRETIKRSIERHDIKPVGEDNRGFPTYDVESVRGSVTERKAAVVEAGSLKDRKLSEQVRKLQLENDKRAGLLMPRSEWASTCAVAAVRWRGFEIRYKNEWPPLHAKAGESVSDQRKVVETAIEELSASLRPLMDFSAAPTASLREALDIIAAELAKRPEEPAA
jgi:hypothetical protein